FLTDLMRRRMSNKLAIVQSSKFQVQGSKLRACLQTLNLELGTWNSVSCPGCGYRLRGGGRAGRSLRRAGRLGLRVERGLLPSLLEVGDRLLHLFFEVVAERLLLADGVEYAGVRRFDEAQE